MPRKPVGDAAMTSTERVHRFREKQRQARGVGLTDRQKLNQAQRELAQLRQQLAAAARQEPAKASSASSGLLAEARQEIERLRQQPAAAALDPDSAAARTIKALQTRIKNLQHELAHTRDLVITVAKEREHMDFKTSSLISKALHSDQGAPSAEVREAALKAFNAWKSDSKAAAEKRKAR